MTDSKDQNEDLKTGKEQSVIPILIDTEMQNSYLDYAMSVIVSRALPDVRDGLKPVHRRILYAMHESGYEWNKQHRKSARVVGDVIGKYHPHGDQAVYDALVRLAQDFSMSVPLLDGQGNFGSMDGDRAAAMRYTEVRMAKISDEMLGDIEKETVSFSPNYDGSEHIPDVLPTKIPNLLVNGSSGIAVGLATNILPHNLRETIDGALAILKDPEISIDDLVNIIPGPDFPTAGIITIDKNDSNGIRAAYETGKGKVIMQAKADIPPDEKSSKKKIIEENGIYPV